MKYRLGLDLGTNSIGWAVIEIKDDDTVRLADAGVRIFPDGREPGRNGRIGEPLAVQRPLRVSRGKNYESINKIFSNYRVSKCRMTPDGVIVTYAGGRKNAEKKRSQLALF
ncbi:MAG: hypothetical protein V3S41_04395 [Spirochaetia bacterium]